MNKALAIARPEVTFATLKPPVGTPLQLECTGMSQRLSARLLGYQEHGSLMISTPKVAGSPLKLIDGAKLEVKLISGVSLCSFRSQLICSYDKPHAHWHLAYPEHVTTKPLRNKVRVPVNLLVAADEYKEGSLPSEAGWPQTILCTDISLSGLNLLAKQPLGDKGDRFYLNLRLRVADEDQVVLAPAFLRKTPEATGKSGYKHGLEFFDLNDNARLVLAGFVYQQCLLEAGYGDYLAEVAK